MRINPESIEYVKVKLKQAFYDVDYTIRKTVSSIMSKIIVKGGFNAWSDLLPFLTENLSKSSD